MIKRIYHVICLLALINLFALGGLAAYLFSSGRLNGPRIEQMAMVLRGQFPQSQPAATQPAVVTPPPAPERSRAEIARLEDQRRLHLHQIERSKRELEDRYNLNQQIVFTVAANLKEIERREQQFKKEKAALEKEYKREGFTQEVQVLRNTPPKKVRDLLSKRKDADVVELFMALDVNSKAGIVEACKTPQELDWARRILTLMEKRQEDAANGVDGSERPDTAR